MTTLNRSNEQNIIGYAIPRQEATIIGKTDGGWGSGPSWAILTGGQVHIYSTGEMEEVYGLDMENSDLERLGWTA